MIEGLNINILYNRGPKMNTTLQAQSSPSSRALLAGEQPETSGLLRFNDRKLRHRRMNKQRRYERLAPTSQLSVW